PSLRRRWARSQRPCSTTPAETSSKSRPHSLGLPRRPVPSRHHTSPLVNRPSSVSGPEQSTVPLAPDRPATTARIKGECGLHRECAVGFRGSTGTPYRQQQGGVRGLALR